MSCVCRYYNLALLLHDEFAGKDEAAKVGRIAQQLAPNAPESNAAMGVIDLLKQNYGEAHRWFTKSLHLRRGPPLASNTSQLTKSLQNGFLGSSYDDIGKQSRRNSNRLGSWGEAEDGGLFVALHKLEHDTEQLEYQLSGHLLPRDLHSTMQDELAVLQGAITELRKRLQPVHTEHEDGRVTQVSKLSHMTLVMFFCRLAVKGWRRCNRRKPMYWPNSCLTNILHMSNHRPACCHSQLLVSRLPKSVYRCNDNIIVGFLPR